MDNVGELTVREDYFHWCSVLDKLANIAENALLALHVIITILRFIKEELNCNLYSVFKFSIPFTVVCLIHSPIRRTSIHPWLILVFQTVILELGYERMKCDLYEALDSGAMRDCAEQPPPPFCPEDPWNWAEWLHSSLYELLSICST